MTPYINQVRDKLEHDLLLVNLRKVKVAISLKVALILCVILFHLPSAHCIAQSTVQSLLALSKGDHTLAIVDPVSLKVIARVPVGEDPHEVIASSDGRTAYVSIYGGGRFHELDVID